MAASAPAPTDRAAAIAETILKALNLDEGQDAIRSAIAETFGAVTADEMARAVSIAKECVLAEHAEDAAATLPTWRGLR